MRKLVLAAAACLMAAALSACGSVEQPKSAAMPPPTKLTAPLGMEPSVPSPERQAQLNGNDDGGSSDAKFQLMKTGWVCAENCLSFVSMRFSAGRGGHDLIVDAMVGGKEYREGVLVSGYAFFTSGPLGLNCRLVTDNDPQCAVPNRSTGLTDHVFFRRTQ